MKKAVKESLIAAIATIIAALISGIFFWFGNTNSKNMVAQPQPLQQSALPVPSVNNGNHVGNVHASGDVTINQTTNE